MKFIFMKFIFCCLSTASALADGSTSSIASSQSPNSVSPSMPLHTDGTRIVDANGKEVRLKCVNWYGAHMERFAANGLDRQPLGDIAKSIPEMGFNCVRLNFSTQQMVENPVVKDAVLSANTDLQGKHSVEIFDLTVKALTDVGLMVILNNHIGDAGWCCGDGDGNGLWWNKKFSVQAWEEVWTKLVTRHMKNALVVGADLRNELRSMTIQWSWNHRKTYKPTWGWGDDGNEGVDWRAAAERCGNNLLAINSDLLVIVEGLNYATVIPCIDPKSKCVFKPVNLTVPNRLVYSGHVYTWTNKEWSNLSDSEADYKLFLDGMTRQMTGPMEHQAPFWLGEFGEGNPSGYWKNVIRFLEHHPHIGFAYWALDGYNTIDGDTGEITDETYGIFNQDYKTVRHQWKLEDLQNLMSPKPEAQTEAASDLRLLNNDL